MDVCLLVSKVEKRDERTEGQREERVARGFS